MTETREQREREREKYNSATDSLITTQEPGQNQTKPGAWISMWISHIDDRDSSTWTNICCSWAQSCPCCFYILFIKSFVVFPCFERFSILLRALALCVVCMWWIFLSRLLLLLCLRHFYVTNLCEHVCVWSNLLIFPFVMSGILLIHYIM